VVDAPPGDSTVRLEFVMPLENRVGWGVSVFTMIALAAFAIRAAARRESVIRHDPR